MQKKKPTILLIVGASGSGKTQLTYFLDREFNVPHIVSYTTRKMRGGEIDGLDHYFVNKDEVPPKNLMAAYTVFGDNEYFTLKEQFTEAGRVCSYIVDEDGIRFFQEVNGDKFNIIPVYIMCDEETLIKRGICKDRINRDMKRKFLPFNCYKYHISNNGSVEEFEKSVEKMYKEIIKKYL